MNKKIDHKTVYWMIKTGWHPRCIAKRLECSRRQVDRIAEANGWTDSHILTDFDGEQKLWEFYREGMNESYGKIALRFGRSRQAVQQYFTSEAYNDEFLQPV